MACALNVDQIKDLYGVLYGEIIDRINDKKLPKFDINQFAKELYDELMDPAAPTEEEKALLYIQAVPDIFLLVAGDAQVQDYIIDNDISLNDIIKLSRKFAPSDLKAVKQAVTTKKKSNKEIKVSIQKINIAAKKLVLTDPETGKAYQARAGQNKARVTSSLTTTPQQAVAVNPETMTEEERNKVDEEKAMFYAVVKNIAYLANAKNSDEQDVEYNGVPIRLKPQLSSSVDINYFTEKDKEKVKTYPNGIVVFVADTDGNILFFNEDGAITDKASGRPVYQYIRQVNLKDGKLLLSNRADFYYTLVSPEEQVEQMRKNAEKNKIKFNEVFALAKTKEIAAQQKKELNQLYQLRQQIAENPKANILLPITGGSTGYINTTYKPLSDTDITVNEITDYYIETVGKKGFSYFILSRTKGGVAIDTPVYMQRGDITEELADKIAQVLTTDAKLDGEELTPYDFQLHINSIKGMRPTSKSKMKHATDTSGGVARTVSSVIIPKLTCTQDMEKNHNSCMQLIERNKNSFKAKDKSWIATKQSGEHILEFISSFTTSPEKKKQICEVIKQLNEKRKEWNIAIIGGNGDPYTLPKTEINIKMPMRTLNGTIDPELAPNFIRIKNISGSADRTIDDEGIERQNPLLLLYFSQPKELENKPNLPVCLFTCVFPIDSPHLKGYINTGHVVI